MIDLYDFGRFYGETVQAARNMRDAVHQVYSQEDPDLLYLKMQIDESMEQIETLYQTIQAEREALDLIV